MLAICSKVRIKRDKSGSIYEFANVIDVSSTQVRVSNIGAPTYGTVLRWFFFYQVEKV